MYHFGFGRNSYPFSFFIITSISFLTLLMTLNIPACLASTNQTMAEERFVTIDKSNQNFTQALQAVAEQFDIKIVFHGTRPTVKHDIFVERFNLDRAISSIMHLYGVENNATVYNTENETLVKVDIYGCLSAVNFIPTEATGHRDQEEDDSPLTDDQLNRLVAKNSQMLKDDNSPLTPDQIFLLQEKEDRLKMSEKESNEPLTPAQIERLNEKNELSVFEEARASEPFTSDQLNRLIENSTEREIDSSANSEPLTENELRLLLDKAKK